jgi:SAM-dependent methyltransferase
MNDPLAVRADSYDPQYFAKIAQIEDRHFWFVARNRIISAAIGQAISGLAAGYRVLEVGCGTGTVLRRLVDVCRTGDVMGMDLFPEAVAFASQRASCRVIVGDILNPPALGEFDLVATFDVLEHLPNDGKMLQALHRLLKPGGCLVLTVPAHMSLWSYFDVAACHCRRYSTMGLERLLVENGFKIEYRSEFMMILFPLIWLSRRLHGGRTKFDSQMAAERASRELKIVPVINRILTEVLGTEACAVKRSWSLPFGTSILAVARKV